MRAFSIRTENCQQRLIVLILYSLLLLITEEDNECTGNKP